MHEDEKGLLTKNPVGIAVLAWTMPMRQGLRSERTSEPMARREDGHSGFGCRRPHRFHTHLSSIACGPLQSLLAFASPDPGLRNLGPSKTFHTLRPLRHPARVLSAHPHAVRRAERATLHAQPAGPFPAWRIFLELSSRSCSWTHPLRVVALIVIGPSMFAVYWPCSCP